MKAILQSTLLAGAFCAQALFATAGPAPGEDDAVTLQVAPEQNLIYRHGSREVILEVEVVGQRAREKFRSPVNVSVVLDRSGSMEGAKIEKARQAACVALDRLDPDDVFSLVIYDNAAQILLPPERAGTAAHREELKERIHRIRPGGGTALYAGVQLGAQQVRKFMNHEHVNRIILLSDGLANVGPQTTGALVETGQALCGEGMSVTTIGLGEDFNEDLMTGLAEASHANYYYVKDAEKLPGILTGEFETAGSRVAGRLRIRIEAPAGVHLREILGHPEIHCDEHHAEIELPELFGHEQRLFHLRCAVDDDQPAHAALAQVLLSYQNAATQQSRSRDESVAIDFTDDQGAAAASVRPEIARHVAVLENRLSRETAVRLADAGRPREAAAVLRSQASGNSSAPVASQIPDVAGENRKLESWADELSTRNALGNTSRKAVQWDNYQDKNQKR